MVDGHLGVVVGDEIGASVVRVGAVLVLAVEGEVAHPAHSDAQAVRDQNHVCSREQGARVASDVDISVGVRHGVRFRDADALRVQWDNTLTRERAHATASGAAPGRRQPRSR